MVSVFEIVTDVGPAIELVGFVSPLSTTIGVVTGPPPPSPPAPSPGAAGVSSPGLDIGVPDPGSEKTGVGKPSGPVD